MRIRRVVVVAHRLDLLLEGELEPRVPDVGGVLAPSVLVHAKVEVRGDVGAGFAPGRDVDVVEVDVEDAAVAQL